MNCPLCLQFEIKKWSSRHYGCAHCGGIFVKEEFLLKAENERQRYLLHQASFEDQGYRNFVKPITDYVLANFNSQQLGLDFGCGHIPVLSQILKDKQLNIEPYDPFFFPRATLLEQTYHYIVCCEVVEHFQNPLEEFKLLFSRLKPGGTLIIMTHLFEESIDFKNWYYKNDATHVFIYTEQSFKYLKELLGYRSLSIEGRLVVLKKIDKN